MKIFAYAGDFVRGFVSTFASSFRRGYKIGAEEGVGVAMRDSVRPQQIFAVQAFRRSHSGEILPAFEIRKYKTGELAVAAAQALAVRYLGVVAFRQGMDMTSFEYGEPQILFEQGEVPIDSEWWNWSPWKAAASDNA